ncbi:MAG: WbqC family protein [Bacteroidales bacterium]|nr:WbqC family protein [Bacteroidales bacterium]
MQKNHFKLKFLEPKMKRYKQFENKFEMDLSIIDILMFNDAKIL